MNQYIIIIKSIDFDWDENKVKPNLKERGISSTKIT
jgi:uncharacterized DUF497 family protein